MEISGEIKTKQPEVHRSWKSYILALYLVALLAGLLVACGAPEIPTSAAVSRQHRAVAVRVAPATTGSISVTTAYAAIVEPRHLVDLVPLATGRVKSLSVDFGTEIKKGQVIAELSHGTLDAQLQRAQATLEMAQSRLDSERAVTEPNRIRARAQLRAARAKLDQLLNPSAADLQVAESAVKVAQSKLDALVVDLQVAESAVAVAQSKLGRGQAKLDQLLNPPAIDLQEAESAVAIAESILE